MTLQQKKKLIYTNVQREQLLQAQHLTQFSSLELPLLRPANQFKEEIMSCVNITLHAVIYSLTPEFTTARIMYWHLHWCRGERLDFTPTIDIFFVPEYRYIFSHDLQAPLLLSLISWSRFLLYI